MSILFQELKAVIAALNESELPYALCGGLALAVHGFSRATVDIDILVPESHLQQVKKLAAELGYKFETQLNALAGGQVNITRLTKILQDSGDFVSLDILHASSALDSAWNGRELVKSQNDSIWIVSKSSLIQMKQLRNSPQDKADIERLKELTDES